MSELALLNAALMERSIQRHEDEDWYAAGKSTGCISRYRLNTSACSANLAGSLYRRTRPGHSAFAAISQLDMAAPAIVRVDSLCTRLVARIAPVYDHMPMLKPVDPTSQAILD